VDRSGKGRPGKAAANRNGAERKGPISFQTPSKAHFGDKEEICGKYSPFALVGSTEICRSSFCLRQDLPSGNRESRLTAARPACRPQAAKRGVAEAEASDTPPRQPSSCGRSRRSPGRASFPHPRDSYRLPIGSCAYHGYEHRRREEAFQTTEICVPFCFDRD